MTRISPPGYGSTKIGDAKVGQATRFPNEASLFGNSHKSPNCPNGNKTPAHLALAWRGQARARRRFQGLEGPLLAFAISLLSGTNNPVRTSPSLGYGAPADSDRFANYHGDLRHHLLLFFCMDNRWIASSQDMLESLASSLAIRFGRSFGTAANLPACITSDNFRLITALSSCHAMERRYASASVLVSGMILLTRCLRSFASSHSMN
jgi:hypothetical protein